MVERGRYETLDGLRGVAAFCVVVFHFFAVYRPSIVVDELPRLWPGSDTPLAFLYNGEFAVDIFFALSGFVLANSAAKKHLRLRLTLGLRYLRLAVPALASTLFAWCLFAAMPDAVHSLKALLPSTETLYVYDHNLPGLPYAVASGTYLIFERGRSLFNGVLWTMRIELLGSWGIYLVYRFVPGRWRMTILILLSALLLLSGQVEYLAMTGGALIWERWSVGRLPRRFAWAALIFAVVFGSMRPGYGERVLGLHLPKLLKLGEPHELWYVLASLALLYAVLNLEVLGRPLRHRIAQFLGRISFGLYLGHFPLLFTVCVGFYSRNRDDGPFALIGLFVVFLILALLAATAFTALVDRPLLAWIRRVQGAVKQLSPS